MQTGLDVVYLWGGVALPDGLTYAAYAHRGAYPLIVTALLAAGFVLAAMRPGGPAERKPVIRVLVFLWIAQNVMLVVSSMLRLDLYVQIYSLTWWRVAAFIWMLLVAVGLILIVARIAFNRSNTWLVQMNLATLALLACICAFINFPYVIADIQRRSQQGGVRQRSGARFQLSGRPRAAGIAGDRSLSRGAAERLRTGRLTLAARSAYKAPACRARFVAGVEFSRAPAQAVYRRRRRTCCAIGAGRRQRRQRLTHRILVVDDDQHIREVICVALRKAGMVAQEARDGKEALSRFAGDRPELIVLDIGMPELDGLDVCRAGAKDPPTCRSCSCRRATRRSTACWASKSAATTM